MSQETSWTLTNISYMFGSYLMFHWVRGVPFEFNAGAYDNLNMWEQIDNGDQYTPAKKFLLSVPIVLFLISTHYTHYDLTFFLINFMATIAVVIPKLPAVSFMPEIKRATSNRSPADTSAAPRYFLRPSGRKLAAVRPWSSSSCILYLKRCSNSMSCLPFFVSLPLKRPWKRDIFRVWVQGKEKPTLLTSAYLLLHNPRFTSGLYFFVFV